MKFTKDQIEFIKEKMKEQREICGNIHNDYVDCDCDVRYNQITLAPEPELPEAVEESGNEINVNKHAIFLMGYKAGVKSVKSKIKKGKITTIHTQYFK